YHLHSCFTSLYFLFTPLATTYFYTLSLHDALPILLMFYTSAIAWLLVGTLLAGFTSFKLHSPDLLSNVPFLTWGRIRPAHVNVMLYGWASMAGIGTAIWLMARLCRTTLRHPLLIVAGGVFWNLGVLLGVGGILAGDSTG